jgi:WG containing repeat
VTLFLGQLYDDDQMSKRRPSRILLPCTFAVLLAALSIASQSQQPAPSKSAGLDTSCLYDFERGVIPDCLQKAGNGELSVKQQVLKQLQFDSHGLTVVRSMTNGWMYVSRTGKVVITGVPTIDNWADTFHDGLVRVVRNEKYGFSNRKGQLVISPVYDGAMNFENGKAKVCKGCTSKCVEQECEYSVFSGGEWFQIDTKGAVVSRIRAEN